MKLNKLFKIKDTPQRIARGLALGVFSGIIPGSGPLVALFLALVFKANKISALLGSLATNTWLSIATFFLSIKIGAGIMNIGWQEVKQGWFEFLSRFRWVDLFKFSVLKIILPVLLGYFILALFLGVLSYFITLLILNWRKDANKTGINLSR
ncbi:MAG: DUF2062 domain-containing protein [Candidatus Omnitrophica bacterium]|nr:DUF2062 domain-containing protein [Candidatus Omnitrophota bacterium]